MSKLLLDSHPLVVQSELAVLIGLNESIFVQQLHYWLSKSTNVKNGRKWSYNSYEELHEQFPFWSVRTIKTITKKLKDSGLVFIENFNINKWDKTNWYSLNYDELNRIIESAEVALSEGAKSMVIDSADVAPSYKDKSLTETSSETSTDNKNNKKDFSFSLSKNCQFDNLSEEYKAKLKGYAVVRDGAYAFASFLDHHIAKGSKFKDWSRAYNTWVNNAKGYNKNYNPEDTKKVLTDHPKFKEVFVEYGTKNIYSSSFDLAGNFEVKESSYDVSENNHTQHREVMAGVRKALGRVA